MKRAACCWPRKRQAALFNWSTSTVDVDLNGQRWQKKCIFKFWSNEIFFIFPNFWFFEVFLAIKPKTSVYAKSTTKTQKSFLGRRWPSCSFLLGRWSTFVDARRRLFYSTFHHALLYCITVQQELQRLTNENSQIWKDNAK